MITLALLLLPWVQAKDDIETKLKEFADQMKAAKADSERLSAIDALAATRHPKAAQKILPIITGPFSDAVRVAAADAVGRIGDVKAGQGLQSAIGTFGGLLQSENPNRTGDQKVAEAIVRALGTLKDHSAVKQLSGMTISANVPLMAEVARSLGKIRDLGCMDALLKLHYAANAPEGAGATNVRKPLAPHTLAALRRITGQSLTTPDEWNKWWRANGGSFKQPPEESLGGLPAEVRTFAVFSGKGEAAALLRYDLVFLDPANWTREELKGLRAIALSGEPKAALDKGFQGFVVGADEAADARKKFPTALIVVRGDPAKAGTAANALLVEDLDPKKPDTKVTDALKDAHSRHETGILLVFAGEGVTPPAVAKQSGFLVYVAPDKEYSKLP
ncbi:MAG TPA: hypothetical protein VEN81_17550 [Planctomycetota bacterium]|nr:hypothetical protein [Planctomycetota bacterium]